MGTTYKDKVVISVGGSLIVPNGGIDTDFLRNLNDFIRAQLAENNNRQFFLIVGGGNIARDYRDAGQKAIGHALTRDDLDWLGIHASRLNAHLIRTIFRDIAHPYILKHYEIIRKVEEPIVVGGAWKPGWSTDYCAITTCEDYGIKEMINLSNVDQVFDKDPRQDSSAKPISKIGWSEFRRIVGDVWVPGMNAPFDPIASKKAEELGVKVVVMNGRDFENVEHYFKGKPFTGTVIE